MATIRPLNGRLVVKRIEQLSKTASGLLIIDALATRPNTAEVISVAPDVKGVQAGDRVFYDAGVGQEMKVDGQTVYVLHENNLFGVVKPNGERLQRLAALKHTILFQFLDETGGGKGRFQERSKGSIIIPTLNTTQTSDNRWGKVIAVGPDVVGIQPGDFLLVAAQKWTHGELFGDEKVWKTIDDGECVMAVTDDINETFKF